ncbi:MAG: hypothetical protein LBT48_07220 [Prevotellaceae bacterium]|nr:hypothetical protein [Prevotellaceae bacterium]
MYKKVKDATILTENLGNNKTDISVINEQRMALDHIFKAAQLLKIPLLQSAEIELKKIEDEIKKANAHISRAGYDTYECYATHTMLNIDKILEKYDIVIKSAIINNYSDIIKKLTNIKESIADIRTNKKSPDDDFEKYAKQIDGLIEIGTEIKSVEGELSKEQHKIEEKDKKERRNRIITVISSIIGILGLALAIFMYFKKC